MWVAVVNDNVRYAGEIVPVDTLSTNLAERIGFVPDEDLRTSTAQRQQQSADGQVRERDLAQEHYNLAKAAFGGDAIMRSPARTKAWSIDQLAKSEFFHQKLHDWGMMEVAAQIDQLQGETLEWNSEHLGISERAWNKVIHRGIKPVIVFAHPDVLTSVPRGLWATIGC